MAQISDKGFRVRTMGSRSSTVSFSGRTWPVSCLNRTWTAYSYYYSPSIYGESKTTWDRVTPGYWKLKKKGLRIPHNSFISTTTKVYVVGSSSFQSRNTAPVCTGPTEYPVGDYNGAVFAVTLGSLVTGPTPLITAQRNANLIAQVSTECLSKRYGGQANYTESLAEFHQAYSMFREPLVNVEKFLSDFQSARSYRRLQELRRRGNIGSFTTRVLRTLARTKEGKIFLALLSSEWLRFRYGITPLMGDVQAGLKAVRQSYKTAPKPYTVRANGQANLSTWSTNYLVDGPYKYWYQITDLGDLSVRANWTDVYTKSIWDDLGLTYKNLIGLPWELTKLSFVVDWFANVGELLYANVPLVNVVPWGGTVTTKETRRRVYSPIRVEDPAPPATAYHTGSLADSVVYDITSTVRDPIADKAELVLKDDFRFSSYKRCLDAFALLQQQLVRIRL